MAVHGLNNCELLQDFWIIITDDLSLSVGSASVYSHLFGYSSVSFYHNENIIAKNQKMIEWIKKIMVSEVPGLDFNGLYRGQYIETDPNCMNPGTFIDENPGFLYVWDETVCSKIKTEDFLQLFICIDNYFKYWSHPNKLKDIVSQYFDRAKVDTKGRMKSVYKIDDYHQIVFCNRDNLFDLELY
jgi:hypothetical protein